MGCYIVPNDASTIEDIVAAISRRPQGAELLVNGNLNEDLDEPEGTTCAEDIFAALAASGLEYMSSHFLPKRKYWPRDGRTWSIWRGYWVVRSRTDYLLGKDRHVGPGCETQLVSLPHSGLSPWFTFAGA